VYNKGKNKKNRLGSKWQEKCLVRRPENRRKQSAEALEKEKGTRFLAGKQCLRPKNIRKNRTGVK